MKLLSPNSVNSILIYGHTFYFYDDKLHFFAPLPETNIFNNEQRLIPPSDMTNFTIGILCKRIRMFNTGSLKGYIDVTYHMDDVISSGEFNLSMAKIRTFTRKVLRWFR